MKALALAWHNVLRNRRRSVVTILIATLGTASMLVAGGFTLYTYDSLREGAARDFGHLTVSHPEFFRRDEEMPLQYGMDGHAALKQRLEAHAHVKRVLPRVNLSGLVSNGEKSMIFMGSGADIAGEAAMRGQFLTLVSGSMPGAGARVPEVLLGVDLARGLSAAPGSVLTLLATTSAGAMNGVDVRVTGTVTTGWHDVDQRLVYLGIDTAQYLLATDKVSTLAVFLDATDATPAVLAELASADPAHGYKPWWEQAFYYQSVRALYNRIFGLLGIVIALLVFFSVSNTLAMAVVERTREIGTLRALGALPGELVAGFVREGALIGLLGSALGMLLAGAVSLSLRHAGLEMPAPPGRTVGYPLYVHADPWLYAGCTAAIVALCACAAWLASRKAARLPIVQALAHT